MLDQIRPLFTWLIAQLRVTENAPRWAGLVVASFTAWLAQSGVDLDGEVKAALVLVVTVAITTAVQKLATLPRADLIDGGTH